MPDENKPNVILDSVIWVSSFLNRTGLTAELIQISEDKVNLYTAEEIIVEIRRVLLEKPHIRGRYTYTGDEVEELISLIRDMSTVISQLPDVHVVRDPKDDMIIACAVEAQADYIVSRDRDLLDLGEYQGIEIVTPETFIQYLRSL